MDTHNPLTTPLTTSSRRGFLRAAAMLSAAAAVGRILGEPELARAERLKMPPYVEGAIYINANENPLGPSEGARRAATDAIALGGRYREDLTEKLEELFAAQNSLNPDFVMAFSGSSQPLHYSVLAFCGPQRPLVIADPGYEAGMLAARSCGAPVFRVPLAKDYSHDVRAMCEASPHAGAFYICTPNNPTGTVTRRQQLEYALEHKPQGSILIVDEAYLHFSDEPSALDMVAAGKDVVVLRTFSKLYGMAGLRLGLVAARPDLLEKIFMQGGWTMCPVTAVAAGMASLTTRNLCRADVASWPRCAPRSSTGSPARVFPLSLRSATASCWIRAAPRSRSSTPCSSAASTLAAPGRHGLRMCASLSAPLRRCGDSKRRTSR